MPPLFDILGCLFLSHFSLQIVSGRCVFAGFFPSFPQVLLLIFKSEAEEALPNLYGGSVCRFQTARIRTRYL